MDDVVEARVPMLAVAADFESAPNVLETGHVDSPPEQAERSKALPTPELFATAELFKPSLEEGQVIRLTPVAVMPVISQSTHQQLSIRE